MSSQEEDVSDQELAASGIKKRRVQRACDVCRRKKVRCDGGQMPNNRCSNCITYNNECTYVEAAKKRGPPKGYVEGLENRVITMEKLLTKLCPDSDVLSELGGAFDKEAWLAKGAGKIASSSKLLSRPQALPPPRPAVDEDDLDPSDNELTARHSLESGMKNLNLHGGHPRFFGKSSSVMFLQTAMALRREYTGAEPVRAGPEGRKQILPCKRPEFWRAHPWIIETLEHGKPHENFPPEDLMPSLIDIYFEHANVFLPLLHRPTFERELRDGLHYRDEGFGSTVLLVCALGSRGSSDPRVILKGTDSQHSAGWEWFRQVQWIRRSLLAPPKLYDLQIAALTAMFLHGSATPQAAWTIIGVGIRMAQDVGVHRKKTYEPKQTVEDELWKRAFWVLLAFDRFISSALGRPCAIHDEDFDVDLPTECDDEYWENDDPSLRFKQPADKPSKIAYFNCVIRLNQILAFALRTIYSINKSKVLLGFIGPRWEQHIVSELDSALNKWIDAVPDHLRWDPNRENLTFLSQSTALYAVYYHVQIIVHRPFISSSRKPPALAFPSLAICTNAARSCIHVMDVHFKRVGRPTFINMMAVFSAGVVLLLNIWGGKRTGATTTDPAKEMVEVHRAMKMLKSLEDRWHTAGRLWDILYELASVGDLPLPHPSPTPSNKRDRDSDGPTTPSTTASGSPVPSVVEEQRHFAGTKRVSDAHKRHEHFRTALSSSLTSMNLNGSVDAAPPVIEHFNATNVVGDPVPSQAAMYGSQVAVPSQQYYSQQYVAPSVFPPGPSAVPPSTSQAVGMTPHGGQPLQMEPMLSMQSVMYDQVLSNLSASLMQPSTNSVAQHTESVPPVEANYATPQSESMDAYMNSLGVGAFIPDLTDNGMLSMWSAAPNGFEWDDWGTYLSNFGGMNYPGTSNGHPGPSYAGRQ